MWKFLCKLKMFIIKVVRGSLLCSQMFEFFCCVCCLGYHIIVFFFFEKLRCFWCAPFCKKPFSMWGNSINSIGSESPSKTQKTNIKSGKRLCIGCKMSVESLSFDPSFLGKLIVWKPRSIQLDLKRPSKTRKTNKV
jgi:hypothetical protein